MTISVCMITKNDGDTIQKALESVKTIAHEVVVVDIGSKDETLKHLQDFERRYNVPVKIVNHVWDHNFSKAKNVAIKNASCHWILMLEPSERIKRTDQRKLKSLTLDEKYLGYYLHRLLDPKHPDYEALTHLNKSKIKYKKHTFIPELRLFRNHDLIKFAGVIYESVDKSLHQLGKSYKTNIRLV